jgi:hypothetical protein
MLSTIDHCRSRCKGREGLTLIHSLISVYVPSYYTVFYNGLIYSYVPEYGGKNEISTILASAYGYSYMNLKIMLKNESIKKNYLIFRYEKKNLKR